MTAPRRWTPGEQVLVQEVWRDRVWSARPMTAVRDDGDLLVLWMPAGTEWRAPDSPPERPAPADRGERIAECLVRSDWVHIDRVWRMNTLWLMPHGLHHVVWVCWDREGAHLGWYVNFQRPYVRAGATVQYMDYALDLRVAPDGTATWKDEGDLAQLTSRGLVPPESVRSMRAEGVALSRAALRRDPPFDVRWTDWRPDPNWPVPHLDPRWSLPRLGVGEHSG
ncbi:DUF402 domain-containing protein [Micromonospora sp. NPDC049114]|uniref:DUF402 domain-containing protein n=1 Tax=unclassified Micromonospora TaxID=2617518 RepID=UPI0033CE4BDF